MKIRQSKPESSENEGREAPPVFLKDGPPIEEMQESFEIVNNYLTFHGISTKISQKRFKEIVNFIKGCHDEDGKLRDYDQIVQHHYPTQQVGMVVSFLAVMGIVTACAPEGYVPQTENKAPHSTFEEFWMPTHQDNEESPSETSK